MSNTIAEEEKVNNVFTRNTRTYASLPIRTAKYNENEYRNVYSNRQELVPVKETTIIKDESKQQSISCNHNENASELEQEAASCSSPFQLDSYIENCLQDLDKYLEEMDADSFVYKAEDDKQEIMTNTTPWVEDISSTTTEFDAQSPRLQRGKLLRKTITNTETQFAENISPTINEWRSLAQPIKFPSLTAIQTNDRSSREVDTPTNEMLTQERIFNNMLHECSSQEISIRPRQIGRRAAGQPHILETRSDILGANAAVLLSLNEQRPLSAPAVTCSVGGNNRRTSHCLQPQIVSILGSEVSSLRSSENLSPVSFASTTDSSSITALTSQNIEADIVFNNSEQQSNRLSPDTQNNSPTSQSTCNNEWQWPYSLSQPFALLCCTVGLFNICRFASVTANYGGNFLLQFLLLSLLFGIPLLWLQMCLGAKIKAGPVSMWKVSPICRGIGIAIMIVQFLVAIYSSVSIAWIFVYLRDALSYLSEYPQQLYRWQVSLNDSTTLNTADYFNIVVLQRRQLEKQLIGNEIEFRVSQRLAFYLAILWTLVFLILCRGLRSFGIFVYALVMVPLTLLIAIVSKLLYVVDPSNIQNVFSATNFDDFLINSQTWIAAAQEAFLTWGFLGPSVIAVTSRVHPKASGNILRMNAVFVVLITFLVLTLAAVLGLCSTEILQQNSYLYVPGSFEHSKSYVSIYPKSSISIDLLSYPAKLVPHYSSFIGETYRRPSRVAHESGYQALRFISEIFPAAAVVLSRSSFSSVWVMLTLIMFLIFGIAQLCVMWKPISTGLGNTTSSVLLSCVTGLLLSIPFATEVGVYMLHYVDLILGASWIVPVLWTALIFGIFLIRGRPYNGDDLVNDLKMLPSISAFLALSWNLVLPISLIALAVVDYKASNSKQFYYWRGKAYFSYWSRKLAGSTQISILLLIPVVAIIQIFRYLKKGPVDILDRIQLLYRPTDIERSTNQNGRNETRFSVQDQNTNLAGGQSNQLQDDEPPNYNYIITPPPSYTTATGARLAKLLRQSIRRSVRRMLGASRHTNSILPTESEIIETASPSNQAVESSNETVSIEMAPRSMSLGRRFCRKQRHPARRRPSSAPRSYNMNSFGTGISTQSLERCQISSRSFENLTLNAEPPGRDSFPPSTEAISCTFHEG